MPTVGFEPTISAGEQPQIYALERAATGTGGSVIYQEKLNYVRNEGMYAHRENSFFSYILCVSFQRHVIAQRHLLYFILLGK